jgi:hypothetical protein
MADFNKKQNKVQQDLLNSQKGMSKKFKELTSKLAEVDSELGQNAANLRKNSKDTFIGMLKSKKLADVIRAQEEDKFHRRIELEKNKENIALKKVEDESKKRTGLNEKQIQKDLASFALEEKVRKGSIDSDQRALDERIQKQAIRGDAEKKDFEKLQGLRQAMLDAESSGAQSVRMANGQMQNITDARIVLQDAEIENNERTNKVKEVYLAEQEKINADIAKLESDKVAALVETTAETESINAANIKALELHTRNMEGIDNKETEMRTKFLQQQNDIMDDDSKFTGFSDALKDLTSGVIDLGGWADDATKFVNNVQTVMQGIGSQVAKVSKKLFSMLPDSIQEKLGDAWKFMSGGLKKMGTQFLNMGKQFLKGAVRLAVSAATLVAGMLATAASVLISGIVMLAPAILIGLAIAGLIFGIMYLAKKFEENKEMIMFKWGLIQEAFSIAIAGLILWKDKAVSFIGNTFKSIWLSIKSLFSAVLTGIENGINFAIQGINSFLPERFQIDEVDIGAKGMAAGLNEEKAAFAIEKEKEAVEFAERKDVLETRTEVMKQAFIDGPPPKTGEDIAVATTEVKQGEKQGNQVNVVNTSSSPTTVSNTQVHTGSGSPRDTDRTAVGLNAIAV